MVTRKVTFKIPNFGYYYVHCTTYTGYVSKVDINHNHLNFVLNIYFLSLAGANKAKHTLYTHVYQYKMLIFSLL